MEPIGEKDFLTCRICLDDAQRRELISPCACSGGSKWVHRECLNRWRSIKEDKAFSRCTECLRPYKLVCQSGDNTRMVHARRCRFTYLVARDFSVVFLSSQLLIAVLGLIVYVLDLHSHALIESLRQTSHPMLFYYLSGLFFSLALLGMWYTLLQMGCCGDSSSGGCSVPSDCVCADGCIYPIYYTSPHAAGVDCCGLECCACCGQGAGESTGAAGCGDCAVGAGAGEECVMCLVVAVVIFALVGAVVCVVMGIAFAQKVVRSHYHVLQKLTLASDYIVADLAEGALPVGDSTSTTDEEDGGLPVYTASSAGYWPSPLHTASHSAYARLSAGDEEAGLALMELRSLGSLSEPASALPSAPPLPPMDRDADPSADVDPHLGASAPYDPHMHHFSRSQHAELVARGLL